MEISLLKALLNNVSSFIHLASYNSNNSNLVQKFYQKAEEILKLLKPVLDAIVDSEIAFDGVLNEIFEKLGQSVDELRDLIQTWQPFSSKANFVLQCESSISKLQASVLDCFQLLKSFDQHLPDELSSSSLEYCIEKIKHMGYGQTTSVIKEATKDLVDGVGLSSEILCKIAELLCLGSNQDILIEAVALEKLKENAEQGEKIREAEFFDQMISVVTQMHDHLVLMKQSQTSSPVPIPADFCCPLSLELMTDPVIVASGQTYERAFIKNWIELGLNVCPKTRQTLSHINLIPNFTVKALIANWCETNHVDLPDPKKSVGLNQSLPLIMHAEAGSTKDMNILSHARGNQQMSPESTLSASSPGKNVTSLIGIHREGSPLHTQSAVAGHGQSLNVGRLSLVGPGERTLTSGDGCVESVSHHSAPLSRNDISSAVTADPLLSQGHIRSASASSALNSENFSQGYPGDANESSGRSNDVSPYSSDCSGEVKAESRLSTYVNNPNREPEFSLRLTETRSRSQTIWRRPSNRLVPRIASSSAVETRADLSGIASQVQNLVEDLKSSSIDTQRMAAAELRQLAKHNTDNRIVIANCGAISLLVNLLSSTDTEIQENAVTALLNLSINDNNKIAIANAEAIEPLIHVLKTGSPQARENSAATLFSLSVIEENKVKIGRSGAIGPLVDLLGNGTPRGKKDAATALFNLSIFHENKDRIVLAGAVKHLVELMDPAGGMVDKAVAVLANLATIPEGRTQIGAENGIPVLVEVVELASARGKENAAATLLQLCTNSSRFCNRVLQEGAVPPLVALSQSGTPRAKEKAQALLSYFRSQRHGNFVRG